MVDFKRPSPGEKTSSRGDSHSRLKERQMHGIVDHVKNEVKEAVRHGGLKRWHLNERERVEMRSAETRREC